MSLLTTAKQKALFALLACRIDSTASRIVRSRFSVVHLKTSSSRDSTYHCASSAVHGLSRISSICSAGFGFVTVSPILSCLCPVTRLLRLVTLGSLAPKFSTPDRVSSWNAPAPSWLWTLWDMPVDANVTPATAGINTDWGLTMQNTELFDSRSGCSDTGRSGDSRRWAVIGMADQGGRTRPRAPVQKRPANQRLGDTHSHGRVSGHAPGCFLLHSRGQFRGPGSYACLRAVIERIEMGRLLIVHLGLGAIPLALVCLTYEKQVPRIEQV